jgi:alkylated DNA repair dioxygenase AlkB
MGAIPLKDGWLDYRPAFLGRAEAEAFFEHLEQSLAWRTEVETESGRRLTLPRSVAWHGEAEAVYPYAGFVHRPEPWTTALLDLKERVEGVCRQRFNGVLGNLYRNGREAMGWHADREPVLGENPVIASLSFGAARPMRFRHDRDGDEFELLLEPGSLLAMGGSLQHHWQHCLPEAPGLIAPRLNLNFRLLHLQGALR